MLRAAPVRSSGRYNIDNFLTKYTYTCEYVLQYTSSTSIIWGGVVGKRISFVPTRTYPPVYVPCTTDYVYVYVYVYRLSNACSLPLYLILVRHWPCFLNVIKFSRLLKRHRGLVFFYIFENLYILTGWYRIDDKPKLCHHRTRATYTCLYLYFFGVA